MVTDPVMGGSSTAVSARFENFRTAAGSKTRVHLEESRSTIAKEDKDIVRTETKKARTEKARVGKTRTQKTRPEKVYKGTGLYWGFLAVLVTLVALVILAAQNTDPVQFSFLSWELRYPLVAIILATIGAPVVLDEAVGFVWRKRRRRVLAERTELRDLRARAARPAAEPAPSSVAAEADAESESLL